MRDFSYIVMQLIFGALNPHPLTVPIKTRKYQVTYYYHKNSNKLRFVMIYLTKSLKSLLLYKLSLRKEFIAHPKSFK